ncbi:MAG: hypothetical protein QHJ81_12700 [Anaerolineae bacterium]|nr:hypothetical protein [Anaerolineae bacterium]
MALSFVQSFLMNESNAAGDFGTGRAHRRVAGFVLDQRGERILTTGHYCAIIKWVRSSLFLRSYRVKNILHAIRDVVAKAGIFLFRPRWCLNVIPAVVVLGSDVHLPDHRLMISRSMIVEESSSSSLEGR